MPRNSIESDRSRSRHRYMNNGNNTSSGSGKGGTPLPQIPDTLMHDPYQPVNRQDYLFHPNRFHQQSQHSQQQQQAPHSHHHSGPGDTRTPVAWTLRDATLSHPIRAATATPSVPFNMATHHSHHLHHQANHAFDSISLHQSSISGRDHRRQHPHPYPYPKKHQANGRHAQRTSSPSATTTSSDDRDEIPIVRHPHHRRQHGPDGRRSVISRSSHMNHGPDFQQQAHHIMHHPHHHPHAHAYTSDRSSNPYGITMGTLRSTKSVPALAMQHDGCPVHGQELMRHPTGAYSVIHAPIYADRRMLAGNHSVVDLRSLPPLPPPLPPQMQPPSAMISNFEGKKLQSAIQLPLPQGMYPSSAQQARHLLMQHREQHQICSPLDVYGVTGTPDPSCCKGHLIVLWIILAVVTMGVISGIVLGVTMN